MSSFEVEPVLWGLVLGRTSKTKRNQPSLAGVRTSPYRAGYHLAPARAKTRGYRAGAHHGTGLPMSSESTVLGVGMYPLADVARYCDLNIRRVKTWFVPRSDTVLQPVFRPTFWKRDGNYTVSFLDLIDAWIAGRLRSEGVTMRTVREAYLTLATDLMTVHPFAHSDIYTDGKRVFVDVAKKVDDASLSEVVSRQHFFPQIRKLLTHIEYSEVSSLAARWNIAKGVVIDPAIGFGQPVVKGTGVTTRIVQRAFRANSGDKGLVADLYGITPAAVDLAVGFEESFHRKRAA